MALFGNRALISTINDDTAALNAGAAYLFDTTTGALLHTFLNPTPELNNVFGNNDNFGFAVALSSTKLAIGAPNESVNGFQNGADLPVRPRDLRPAEHAADPDAVYQRYGGIPWQRRRVVRQLRAGRRAVQKQRSGDVAEGSGRGVPFDAKTGAFLQEVNDTAPVSNDRFGFAVALDGYDALIGAQTDLVGTIRPGQAFYYAGPVAAPEPGTLALLMTGLAGLALVRRRSATSPP